MRFFSFVRDPHQKFKNQLSNILILTKYIQITYGIIFGNVGYSNIQNILSLLLQRWPE